MVNLIAIPVKNLNLSKFKGLRYQLISSDCKSIYAQVDSEFKSRFHNLCLKEDPSLQYECRIMLQESLSKLLPKFKVLTILSKKDTRLLQLTNLTIVDGGSAIIFDELTQSFQYSKIEPSTSIVFK